MDLNELSIKEVNAYYAHRGGIRTSDIRGYANVGCFSSLMQQAAAQACAAAQKNEAADRAASSAKTQTPASQNAAKARASATAQPHAHEAESSGESTQAHAASDKDNICCEQCHLANQLMLQTLSRNLYSQSALNYPLSGYGAWTAYQNMANMAGTNLF